PVFNLPPVVMTLALVLAAVHAVIVFGLGAPAVNSLYEWFGFIPQRLLHADRFDGGLLPLLWTPLTHGFLHANWEHLGFNLAWLAVFGSPVARRYGARGFALIGAAGAVAGAAGFMLFNLDGISVMIGASGAISGLTGAAMRFVFQPVEVSIDPETGERRVLGRRLASWREFVGNRRAMSISLVLLALNAGVGLLAYLMGEPAAVAWQSHVAGFAVGLLAVGSVERLALQPR
ncbi:MAG: rhomboid family intramembrane serine protease, partial [Cucumibacter sp.]